MYLYTIYIHRINKNHNKTIWEKKRQWKRVHKHLYSIYLIFLHSQSRVAIYVVGKHYYSFSCVSKYLLNYHPNKLALEKSVHKLIYIQSGSNCAIPNSKCTQSAHRRDQTVALRAPSTHFFLSYVFKEICLKIKKKDIRRCSCSCILR